MMSNNLKFREQEFVKAYNQLCQKFGVQLTCVIQPRNFGNMLQIEPSLQIAPIDNWLDTDLNDPTLAEAPVNAKILPN